MSSFGVMLRQARKAKRVSTRALSESIGRTSGNVRQVELGIREPFRGELLRRCLLRIDALDRLDEFERAAIESHRFLRFELSKLPPHVAKVVSAVYRAVQNGKLDDAQMKKIVNALEPGRKRPSTKSKGAPSL